MEDLLLGRSFQTVTRLVVEERKSVTAPAPTHPPREEERTARENTLKPRNVKLNHAKVKSIGHFGLIAYYTNIYTYFH